MKDIYIISAKRTAIGTLMGSLSTESSPKLASKLITSMLAETKLEPSLISEGIIGQVITGGSGQNPARQSLIGAGIPKEIPSFTINKVCGSGLKAVVLAAQSISAGDNDLVIAGGQENMSLGMHAAYLRAGNKFGNMQLVDIMQYDGLTDVFSGKQMGITAENIAKQFNISREEQDKFALKSHMKAVKARENGRFRAEIVPIEIIGKKQTVIIDQDEGIRPDSTLEQLTKLKPAFLENGSVTAGNSSSINDGAALLLIASGEMVKKHNLSPLARIASYASSGVEPSIMGTGPVPASKLALSKAGWHIESLDLIECNEAFAAQSIYVNREMRWDESKVNVNGGAIALGHPIGASGARVLVTLIHEMQKTKTKKSIATLCIGGGMGIAICIEGLQ